MSDMNKNRMLWLDVETTGLAPPPDTTILEVAAIVTDNDLNELGHVSMLVPQPRHRLDGMEEGARKLHEASGLLDELSKLPTTSLVPPYDISRTERRLIDLLAEHDAVTAPLCGSSIHYDRAYVNYYLPGLADLLHYRNFDVSQVKQMVERWMPWLAVEVPEKKGTHRALDDIRESLELARCYKRTLQALYRLQLTSG